tara:strand:+ start:193 stop:348 length:156 start_codon:yes stop_codon:yes gene_type:complete
MENLLRLIFFIVWVVGIVIANGFWSTLVAFFIPFWGWYLIIEKVLINYGIV